MSSPVYIENYLPAAKQAGGVQTKLPIKLGTGGVQFLTGTGAPTASLPKGSLYIRLDGSSTSTRLYVATDAVGTWTNVTTAA